MSALLLTCLRYATPINMVRGRLVIFQPDRQTATGDVQMMFKDDQQRFFKIKKEGESLLFQAFPFFFSLADHFVQKHLYASGGGRTHTPSTGTGF